MNFWTRLRTDAQEVASTGWELFIADFRRRYRQAYLGYFWAFSRLILVGAPLVLLGSQFGMGGGRSTSPYVVSTFTGLVFFQVFWDSVVSPQWIGRRVRGLLRELPVRYEALVVGGCFYVLFNLALSTAALALTFAWAGVLPAPTAPLALLGVPVLIVAGLVIGTVLLPIVYVYVDFRYAMAYLSPLLMIATPIIYESPTQGLLAQVNRWNPLTVFVGVPKNWVLAGFDGREGLLASAAAAVLILLVLSLRFMRRSMPIAVERLL